MNDSIDFTFSELLNRAQECEQVENLINISCPIEGEIIEAV